MNASVGVPSALLLDGALAAALIPVCVFSAYVGYIIYIADMHQYLHTCNTCHP